MEPEDSVSGVYKLSYFVHDGSSVISCLQYLYSLKSVWLHGDVLIMITMTDIHAIKFCNSIRQ